MPFSSVRSPLAPYLQLQASRPAPTAATWTRSPLPQQQRRRRPSRCSDPSRPPHPSSTAPLQHCTPAPSPLRSRIPSTPFSRTQSLWPAVASSYGPDVGRCNAPPTDFQPATFWRLSSFWSLSSLIQAQHVQLCSAPKAADLCIPLRSTAVEKRAACRMLT